MRVVILGTRGFPNIQGGVERHCECLSTNLVKHGCDVIVMTRKPYVNDGIPEFKGVKLVPIPTIRNKSMEASLHTLLGIFCALLYKPDILHIQAIGSALFIPLAKLLGMKVVLTSHGSNYKHLKWGKFAQIVLKLSEYLGVRFADRIIAVSSCIADEIKRRYNKDSTTIENGVIVRKRAENGREVDNYGLIKGKYVLSVGRVVRDKGFDILIDAFNTSQIDGWKLVIVGQADHEDEYSLDIKKRARENGNVILTGFLNEKRLGELYSYAGLFVLPSYYEGLPISLLEAMSYELPCIASDIPGNRNVELSEDRYFEAGNSRELAEKMRQYINRKLTPEEGRKQLDIIAERYDWNKIAVKTLKVYRKTLDWDQLSEIS